IKETGTVPLLADYTAKSPAITKELAKHGRSAIPLVLVYPGKPGAAPEILPVFLQPDTVLQALDRAAKANSKP
ncbi:MAG: disulfide bond formation protein DsbD, partial [Verrucomicrobiales bacterium]